MKNNKGYQQDSGAFVAGVTLLAALITATALVILVLFMP